MARRLGARAFDPYAAPGLKKRQARRIFMLTIRRGTILATIILLFVAWPARTEDAQPAPAPLVTRGRVQLNLAGAEMIFAAAKLKAVALGVKVNIAVVDDGGHLLAFARMDGARPASAATAQTKAVTAATFRQETGTLPAKGEPDVLLNLSLQNAAAASGGKITTLKGGVPVVIDDQVIGAVGVGGGSGDQDAEVARAGIQALLDELRANK
jgi:glc operon protein GlcG